MKFLSFLLPVIFAGSSGLQSHGERKNPDCADDDLALAAECENKCIADLQGKDSYLKLWCFFGKLTTFGESTEPSKDCTGNCESVECSNECYLIEIDCIDECPCHADCYNGCDG